MRKYTTANRTATDLRVGEVLDCDGRILSVVIVGSVVSVLANTGRVHTFATTDTVRVWPYL